MSKQVGEIAKHLLVGEDCSTCYWSKKFFVDAKHQHFWCSKIETKPDENWCYEFLSTEKVLYNEK